MISFSKISHFGRLGNKLFQYAFLRTQADKLGVQFYCPPWDGDDFFDLKDDYLRAKEPKGILHIYDDRIGNARNHWNITLQDNTEVAGFFTRPSNFDEVKVRQWYVFKPEKVSRVDQKYLSIDFSEIVGIHVRLGDKKNDTSIMRIFFVPRLFYYKKALKLFGHRKNILVFSDDIFLTKKYLAKLPYSFTFVEGNEPWEDMYLMSKCHDLICGASTLSWWAGWLNKYKDKKVVYPKEQEIRPFGPHKNNPNFVPDTWIKIRSLLPIIDSYPMVTIYFYLHKTYHHVLGYPERKRGSKKIFWIAVLKLKDILCWRS